jgi:hypothetical protein
LAVALEDLSIPLNWAAVNSAILLASLGFIWRQSRIIDQLKQVLLGMEGRGGIMRELELLRERTDKLAVAIEELKANLMKASDWDGEERRKRGK